MKNVIFSWKLEAVKSKKAHQMIFYEENPEKSEKLGQKMCEIWLILLKFRTNSINF